MSSKAQVLEKLYKNLKTATIPILEIFSVEEFHSSPNTVISRIKQKFKDSNSIIIRSSFSQEDSSVGSFAGHFLSIADIPLQNKPINDGIIQVIESYKLHTNEINNEHFFIQAYLQDVVQCGVITTYSLGTLSPYYHINYSDNGSTDSVTSGAADTKLRVIFRGTLLSPESPWTKHIAMCKELESIYSNIPLDIEFALDSTGKMYLFQVRPIAQSLSDGHEKTQDIIAKQLRRIHKKLKKLSNPQLDIHGSTTIWGNMPDWNPIEIIGAKPNRLALSIYKELITDRIWASQRFNYGYKDLRSFPLMVEFIGIPYIDVRASLNSFIPREVPNDISEKMINSYLIKLKKNPQMHDKIEFQIAYSCYFNGIQDAVREDFQNILTQKEQSFLIKELKVLTTEIISDKNGLLARDIQLSIQLDSKFKEITNSDSYIIDKIYWLSEYCKRNGTLPFAGIARCAFISTKILKSLVSTNLITETLLNHFLSTIDTVSGEMSLDISLLSEKKLSFKKFLDTYGHLRPGTYDITSLSYKDILEEKNISSLSSKHNKTSHSLSKDEEKQFKSALNIFIEENDLLISAKELNTFFIQSIKWREKSKFIFTKALSEILEQIVKLGKRIDLTREDLSLVDFSTILSLYTRIHSGDVKTLMQRDIDYYSKERTLTNLLHMPLLITDPSEVYSYENFQTEPNFITLKSVSSKIVMINAKDDLSSLNLKGKIAFIESADPGYDIIFSKSISGLITMYGGANSHMAVRAAELGLPSVIGIGPEKYQKLSKFTKIEINCETKLVREDL